MRPRPVPALSPLALVLLAGWAGAQTLPPTPPTREAAAPALTAPLAAIATAPDRAGVPRQAGRVSCAGGQLTVHAANSSLNGILRAISRCTGMTITGGVADQRVFGDYGPAAPATVLATLLDGTGVNMLLQETAADQPARLILTPRSGGPTPPSPNQAQDTDLAEGVPPQPGTVQSGAQPAPNYGNAYANRATPGTQRTAGAAQPYASAQPGAASGPGVVRGPVSIPQPINNVSGSPNNPSISITSLPARQSVPLDSLPTPSTTPPPNGIVDNPDPPPAGSDTAALLNGNTNVPGNITIQNSNTGATTSPGATNTTLPAPPQSTTPGGAATPQQIYEQLRQMQQQQQNGSQGTSPPSQPASPSTPQP